MLNRDLIVEQLGTLLEQAVRSSVAAGAQYEPGENITTDTRKEWQKVALNLLQLVEVIIRDQQAVEQANAEQDA
jgi:hypothetical protein